MIPNGQIIYTQLLDQHRRIQIPMIQRDYAQGRPIESAVRDLFLAALMAALQKPVDDPTLPLNLDFIYGSVQGEGETRFLPLDGQQRLTTLFLLHWYLAWRDNQWESFAQLFQVGNEARFTYKVRQSSKEFFDELVRYHPSVNPESIPDLTQLITDQPWYFRSWRLDPTIQTVLHMLDAIHARFASSSGLYARLTDKTRPAITFQLLNLENFGLSDDLYIKMNARGKPLTPFETFKARYVEELEGRLDGETFDLGSAPLDAAEYIARRIDTAWTDLFWKLRDPKSHLFDEAFMNVFRAVALVTRRPDDTEADDKKYVADVTRLRSGPQAPSYTDFHEREWLDDSFTRTVIYLLDSWSAASGTLSCLLPDGRYFDEKAFFDKIALNGANLSYAEIVQFAAYAKFVAAYHDSIDAHAFQEWMRIIHNLSVNTGYNRTEDFQRSMRGLDGLLENARNILNHFAESEKPASGFNEQQIAEEKLKAKLILAQNSWREWIDRAEGHGYFKGQIEFLLDFCGAKAAGHESDPDGWTAAEHATLQEQFQRYLYLAKKMFSADGLVDPGAYRWQRALLSIGDYFLPRGSNHSFLVDSATDESSWKRLLRGAAKKAPEARQFLQQLWDQLAANEEIAPQLDSIIEAHQPIEPWRAALVHCPEAFAFCKKNYIRWHNPDTLYLLKRSQLNGAHAELFTYCLHQKLAGMQSKFTNLKNSHYETITHISSEPHILLRGNLQGKTVKFSIFNRKKGYRVQIQKSTCSEIANLGDTLKRIGYSEADDYLQNRLDRSEIEAHLNLLDQALHAGFNNEVVHA
jgi:hypothetical protein